MRLDNRRRLRAAACVSGLLLLGGAVTNSFSASPELIDIIVEDGAILATVLYPGTGWVSGSLVVEFEAAGKRSRVEVPFKAIAGQKIFVRAVTPWNVDKIIYAGIIVDDGAPI